MNTFRFVLYTWCCAVLLYPVSVMCYDILTRSNTEWQLFLPLLAGAVVLGLPALLVGTLTLQQLQAIKIPAPARYAAWSALLLGCVLLLLRFLSRPTLTLTGEDDRFLLPLFADIAVVLLLRYAAYRQIPDTQYPHQF